jgi:transcriptional regulator with XRE-family HTH domain
MKTHLPIYLHSLRKRWALTQTDLAFLLRISAKQLRKIEAGQKPTATVMLGTQIVFGELPRAVFPSFYESLETEIMGRAARLHERLLRRKDRKSVETRRLLEGMIQRTEPLAPIV